MRNVDEALILITGSTDGLGELTARDLAGAGATVLVHGRRKERAEAAAREIREASGGKEPRYYVADFSSLDEVRRLADEILAGHDHLDVLVNNAGVGAGERGDTNRSLSQDGHELRFAVNYLAPFLLTRLLLPLLRWTVLLLLLGWLRCTELLLPVLDRCTAGVLCARLERCTAGVLCA